jgi:hypothetical protein
MTAAETGLAEPLLAVAAFSLFGRRPGVYPQPLMAVTIQPDQPRDALNAKLAQASCLRAGETLIVVSATLRVPPLYSIFARSRLYELSRGCPHRI